MSSATDKTLTDAIEDIAHEFREELENAVNASTHEAFRRGLDSSNELRDSIMSHREQFRSMLKRWLEPRCTEDLRTETRDLLFRMRRANGADGDTGCEA